jgi:hypothetical protein
MTIKGQVIYLCLHYGMKKDKKKELKTIIRELKIMIGVLNKK